MKKRRILKRRIKTGLKRVSRKTDRTISFLSVSAVILVIGVMSFCIIQLVVASMLSPKGEQLERLNAEKEMLLESNRQYEHEIAEYSSTSVVMQRAQKDLEMERAEEVLYLDTEAVSADLINEE